MFLVYVASKCNVYRRVGGETGSVILQGGLASESTF